MICGTGKRIVDGLEEIREVPNGQRTDLHKARYRELSRDWLRHTRMCQHCYHGWHAGEFTVYYSDAL